MTLMYFSVSSATYAFFGRICILHVCIVLIFMYLDNALDSWYDLMMFYQTHISSSNGKILH